MSRKSKKARYINRSNPVNWQWSVNTGLVSWWLTFPGFTSGAYTWTDLVRQNNNTGTLTNFNFDATDGWRGTQGRRGGYGSLLFDGVDDYASGSDAHLPTGNAPRSVACWLNTTYAGTTDLYFFSYGPNAANFSFDFGVFQAGKLVWTQNSFSIDTGTLKVNGGAWHHVAVTWDGATARLYVDGLPIVSDNLAALATSLTGSYNLGRFAGGSSNYLPCSLDDVRIYSRALSDADVQALYLESQQGYRNGLNWSRSNSATHAASVSAFRFNPAWARNSNVLIVGSAA